MPSWVQYQPSTYHHFSNYTGIQNWVELFHFYSIFHIPSFFHHYLCVFDNYKEFLFLMCQYPQIHKRELYCWSKSKFRGFLLFHLYKKLSFQVPGLSSVHFSSFIVFYWYILICTGCPKTKSQRSSLLPKGWHNLKLSSKLSKLQNFGTNQSPYFVS